MALVEAGLLRLDEPIDELVPELAGRRVLRAIDAELDDTVAAHRSITVEDLLSFRLGFGSVMAPPGSFPIQRAEAELGLQSIGGPPWPPVAHDVDSWIGALGSLPLMYQPGERWLYNTSAQVLGVVLARACGRRSSRCCASASSSRSGWPTPASPSPPRACPGSPPPTAPIPRPARSRCSTIPPAAGGARRPRSRTRADGSCRPSTTTGRSSPWSSRGSGRGGRVLAPATVALMTADRLTSAQRDASALFLGEHGSWGLGLAVPATGARANRFPCGVGWDGGTGTAWRTNPGPP